MNQILSTANRDVSTMKERCLKLFQKGCREWNFEGQWILKFHARDKHAANLLNSGSICQSNEEQQASSADDGVVATWGKFWDMSKTLLVEKSPQNMLKIATLRRIFAKAKAVKFIIVIKHPVTLNVALPREYDWMTHKESVKSFKDKVAAALRRGDPSPLRAEMSNRMTEIVHNAQYFSTFMTQNQTTSLGNRCSMGWLEAMEELYRNLQSDKRNLDEVRIVRFEDFDRPHHLCQRLFNFVFGSNGTAKANTAVRDVCDRYFTPVRMADQVGGRRRSGSTGASSGASQGVRPLAATTRTAPSNQFNRQSRTTQLAPAPTPTHTRSTNNPPPVHGRRLRLAGSTEKPDKNKVLEFSPLYFQKSTQRRIQQYHDAFDRIASETIKTQLQAVSERLKPFGYSLERGDEYSYKKEASVFEPWHL